MATGTSDGFPSAPQGYAAPFVVLAVVLGARIGLGTVVGRPAHEITLIAATAGTLGASVVLLTGADAYLPEFTPTMRLLERVSPGGPTEEYRHISRWLILFAGTIAGGVFPTAFRQGLGLSGQYFAGFPYALGTAVAWGVTLFALALAFYLATGSLSEGEEVRIFAEFFVVYTVPFALVVSLSRLVWFRLLGI
jgi:hypothetical protein